MPQIEANESASNIFSAASGPQTHSLDAEMGRSLPKRKQRMVEEQPFFTHPHPPHYREGEAGPSGHNLRHQHHTYHQHGSDEENTSFRRIGHFERSVADLIERCELEEASWQRIRQHQYLQHVTEARPAHAERHFQHSYSIFAEEDEYRRLSSDDHEESSSQQWHRALQVSGTEHVSQEQQVTADEHLHLQVDAIVVAPERPEDAHVRGVTRARVARHRQDRQLIQSIWSCAQSYSEPHVRHNSCPSLPTWPTSSMHKL